MFDDLFSYAQKKEIEKASFPIWLTNFAMSTLKKEETISFEEFLKKVNDQIVSDNTSTSSQEKRSTQEIISEISVIADLNRKEMLKNG